MNFRKLPKPPFLWTPEADARLRDMLAKSFTTSGIAEILRCRHVEVIARATLLGLAFRHTRRTDLILDDMKRGQAQGRAA